MPWFRSRGESEDPLAQEMAKLIPLAAALEAKIAQQEQQWLLTEVEQPLAEVLASMELIGFSLDTEGLTAYGQELDTQLTARAEEIYELAGGQFNINSPMQLGNVLFEKLGLPTAKRPSGAIPPIDVLDPSGTSTPSSTAFWITASWQSSRTPMWTGSSRW